MKHSFSKYTRQVSRPYAKFAIVGVFISDITLVQSNPHEIRENKYVKFKLFQTKHSSLQFFVSLHSSFVVRTLPHSKLVTSLRSE